MTDASTTTSSTPAPVPGIAGPVRVDWGDWADQLLVHERPAIEAMAQTGVQMTLRAIPIGSFLEGFVGPAVTKQYVDQALTSLEDVLKGSSLTVSPSEALASLAAKLFNQAEPSLASFLGGTVEPMIQGWVAKLKL